MIDPGALDGVTVTISDIRKADYCVAGVRSWWPRQNLSISFSEFLRTGMPAADLIAGGDAHAEIVVARKLAREAAEKANG